MKLFFLFERLECWVVKIPESNAWIFDVLSITSQKSQKYILWLSCVLTASREALSGFWCLLHIAPCEDFMLVCASQPCHGFWAVGSDGGGMQFPGAWHSRSSGCGLVTTSSIHRVTVAASRHDCLTSPVKFFSHLTLSRSCKCLEIIWVYGIKEIKTNLQSNVFWPFCGNWKEERSLSLSTCLREQIQLQKAVQLTSCYGHDIAECSRWGWKTSRTLHSGAFWAEAETCTAHFYERFMGVWLWEDYHKCNLLSCCTFSRWQAGRGQTLGKVPG